MQGFGIGNAKLGKHITTYSRTPGATCPGASDQCLAKCYTKRMMRFPSVPKLWRENESETIPAIPKGAKLVRIHVAGDFDTVPYIKAWITRIKENPGATFWGYTRSWRIAELLPHLETLRALPNVRLFASTDPSVKEAPPSGWRIAYMSDTPITNAPQCMEQTGAKADCEACGYCFKGFRGNIRFAIH